MTELAQQHQVPQEIIPTNPNWTPKPLVLPPSTGSSMARLGGLDVLGRPNREFFGDPEPAKTDETFHEWAKRQGQPDTRTEAEKTADVAIATAGEDARHKGNPLPLEGMARGKIAVEGADPDRLAFGAKRQLEITDEYWKGRDSATRAAGREVLHFALDLDNGTFEMPPLNGGESQPQPQPQAPPKEWPPVSQAG